MSTFTEDVEELHRAVRELWKPVERELLKLCDWLAKRLPQ